ncbi:MAG: hypothetical protein N2043_01470 [Ignavibacterium sp.]|nr:hypothetical protein [Ignavibacterium sp.]
MKYIIKQNEFSYKIVSYYTNESMDSLYMIVYDSNYGYALLNVETGVIETLFEDNFDSLLRNSNLEEMIPLEQTKPTELKVLSKR